MGIAVAKVKQTRAAKAAVTPRDSARKTPKAARTKSPEILAAEAASGVPWGERTELARNCGKLVEAIFRFTKKNDIPPSLKRRLKNCANDLWDVEWEEDSKSGALECGEFGRMGEQALRDYKTGKTKPL